MDEQNPLNPSSGQPLSPDPLQSPPPVAPEPSVPSSFNTPLPSSSWTTPTEPTMTPEPVAPISTTTTTTPGETVTTTTIIPPAPPADQPESQWPEQKPKSKVPQVLMGVIALFLVVGAAVGAYVVSTRVSQQQAVAPTAPLSEPMASTECFNSAGDSCFGKNVGANCGGSRHCEAEGVTGYCSCVPNVSTPTTTTGCAANSVSTCVGKSPGSICQQNPTLTCNVSSGGSGNTPPTCSCGSGQTPTTTVGPTNPPTGGGCSSASAASCQGKSDGDSCNGGTCNATGQTGNDGKPKCTCGSGGRPECPAGYVSNGLCEGVDGLRPITIANCCEEEGSGGACTTDRITGKIKFAKTGTVAVYSKSPVQFRADIVLTGPKNNTLGNVLIDNKIATVSKTFDVVAGQEYTYTFKVIYPDPVGKKPAYGWNPPPVAGKCGPKNNPGTGAGKCGARDDINPLLDYAKDKANLTGITVGTTKANVQCWSDPVQSPPDPISDYDYNDFALVFGYTDDSPTVVGGACMDIKIYKMKVDGTYPAVPLTTAKLNTLKEGDKIRLTATANKKDLQARFKITIDGVAETPIWKTKIGYTDDAHKVPYYDYEITKVGTYSFRAQVSTK